MMRYCPRKALILAALPIIIFFDTCASAQGLVNLPLDKMTEQLGGAVKSAIDIYDKHKSVKSAHSVGQLVIDLSSLSGEENTLAGILNNLNNQQIYADETGITRVLTVQWSAIRTAFGKVSEDLIDIDPDFAQKNPLLQLDLGNFAHDGALYFCIASCVGEFWDGRTAVKLTDASLRRKFIDALKDDVMQIRTLASQVH